MASSVLIIGGGIAGMTASLEVANAGYDVYLVERSPWIGGRMSQLDKTFPTLDCSSCITTPKMVEVGSHPLIHLLTLSEVVSVEREPGSFRVKVLRKPRYVIEDRCTGCGACAEACRLKGRIPDEFNMGLGKRGAVYLAFPQAVPMKYAVDSESCLTVTRGKCGKGTPSCLSACPQEAIDFSQKERIEELEVGAIIVATGYDPFPAEKKPELGYGKYEEVITGLELERLLSATGPTSGEIVIGGKRPRKFFFIHCVGSRDHQVGNTYCSRVCCMYTAKQAHQVKDSIPDAEVRVCYIDMRAYGKGYESFYERVQNEGIIYQRGVVSEVYRRGERLVVRGEDTLLGRPFEEETDVVVLAVGLTPRKDAEKLSEVLGIELDEHGFFREKNPNDPVLSTREGVFLAGCCQGPKDIPDTVSQALGAASKALSIVSRCRGNEA